MLICVLIIEINPNGSQNLLISRYSTNVILPRIARSPYLSLWFLISLSLRCSLAMVTVLSCSVPLHTLSFLCWMYSAFPSVFSKSKSSAGALYKVFPSYMNSLGSLCMHENWMFNSPETLRSVVLPDRRNGWKDISWPRGIQGKIELGLFPGRWEDVWLAFVTVTFRF